MSEYFFFFVIFVVLPFFVGMRLLNLNISKYVKEAWLEANGKAATSSDNPFLEERDALYAVVSAVSQYVAERRQSESDEEARALACEFFEEAYRTTTGKEPSEERALEYMEDIAAAHARYEQFPKEPIPYKIDPWFLEHCVSWMVKKQLSNE